MGKILIYKGPTGCGKTWQAFNRLNCRQKAIYIAPCRQLVYESAINYGNANSHVLTSDIKIGNAKTAKISFRTYEACDERDLVSVDVLIIDEAHFMSDPERGPHLVNLVHTMNKLNKKVILLSATMSFTVEGAKIINLPARGREFQKEEIKIPDALDRAKNGIPTLVFHTRRDECGSIGKQLGMPDKKIGIINADTSVEDRIKIVDLYNQGKITIIEATNAMAQGVNVPCENIINIYNGYDNDETIIQKFGRLGRTGVTKENARLTYAGYFPIEECQEELEHLEFNNFLKIERVHEGDFGDPDLRSSSTEDQKRKTALRIQKAWRKQN